MTKLQGLSPTAALILLAAKSSHAERDGNAPWGDGQPPRGFDMWWKDPTNVLEDLDQFKALYVKVHGCVWSEYGIDNFDDDGENRDGDEEWYQGRTQPFRANAAYSLYGVLKGTYRMRKCTKATYINTFVTNMGADTILNVLGRGGFGNADDNGYGNDYCYELQQNGNGRALSSGDNGDNDGMSQTMGCSLTSDDFVMATFEGSYCDGNYFLDETDSMEDYNSAMDGVTCEKIWGNWNSVAGDELLAASSACDGYTNHCPDPYGLKQRYAKMAGLGGRNRAPVHKFFRGLSWIALLVGVSLMGIASYLRHRYGKKSRRKSGSRKKKESRKSSSRSGSKGTGLSASKSDLSEESHLERYSHPEDNRQNNLII